MKRPLFRIGRLCATQEALDVLDASNENPMAIAQRHICGDWGEVCEFDKSQNEEALRDGERLMSVFKTRNGDTIWVITDAADDDGRRRQTTILLPEEY